jgi:hypothetical protein
MGYDISLSASQSQAASHSGSSVSNGGSKTVFSWQSAAIIGGALVIAAVLIFKIFKR